MGKRILVLNYEYPPVGGGAGVIARHIAEGLAAKGHQITVVTTWFHGEKEETLENNLRIIRLKCRRKLMFRSNPIEMLSWIRETKKYLRQGLKAGDYDLCMAHFAMPGGEVAKLLLKKFRIPYIIVSHGHDIPWFFPRQMFFYHLLTFPRIRSICRKAERIVLQSWEMKDNADRFTGSDHATKNIIIYNGCDTTIFRPDAEKKSEVFKILFVGRLVRQKDPLTFLKAVKLFSEKFPEFMVHILGDGPLRRKMEKFVTDNGLEERVRFAGWVDKGRMLEECQSAHIKVSPSLVEGMSVAVMESLACGQYIITTPVSENKRVIRESVSGEIFKLRDHEDIARKLEDFYISKFASGYEVPKAVVEDFRKNFDWSSAVSAYEALINEITATPTLQ
jgi:glycosyltransferase involved in cell wall biosynthesis